MFINSLHYTTCGAQVVSFFHQFSDSHPSRGPQRVLSATFVHVFHISRTCTICTQRRAVTPKNGAASLPTLYHPAQWRPQCSSSLASHGGDGLRRSTGSKTCDWRSSFEASNFSHRRLAAWCVRMGCPLQVITDESFLGDPERRERPAHIHVWCLIHCIVGGQSE